MKVMVTGSTGHVGGAIVEHLVAQGDEVIGVSRGRSSRLSPHTQQACLDISDLTFIGSAQQEIAPCDAIVHAAANLGSAPSDPDIAGTNCVGTKNVCGLAAEWGVSRFIFISTISVVGVPREHPVTETHVPDPANVYSASKLFGEKLTESLGMGDIQAAILRITSPVGPGLRASRIFSTFVNHALEGSALVVHGRGERSQDYVDVRDISRAVEGVLGSAVRGVLNIARGEAVSNRSLAERIVRCLGSESPIETTGDAVEDDSIRWEISIEKAASEIGFSPAFTLEDSIRALAAEIKVL